MLHLQRHSVNVGTFAAHIQIMLHTILRKHAVSVIEAYGFAAAVFSPVVDFNFELSSKQTLMPRRVSCFLLSCAE